MGKVKHMQSFRPWGEERISSAIDGRYLPCRPLCILLFCCLSSTGRLVCVDMKYEIIQLNSSQHCAYQRAIRSESRNCKYVNFVNHCVLINH